MKKELDEVKQCYHRAIDENIVLIKRLDKVDWRLINQAEEKLVQVLSEFQLSVDGVLMSIEADMKRWKNSQSDLTAKYE